MSDWIVAQTEPRAELAVERRLLVAERRVYLPRCRELGRVLPLFPGYLFVHAQSLWRDVRWTIGVVAVLMAGDEPARLADRIVDAIKHREKAGFVELPDRFEVGQQVRITGGQFAGMIGLWHGQTGRERERVLLALLGQMVPVELDTGFLEET